MLLGGHVARRWGLGDFSAPPRPWLCPCPSGLWLTVFGLNQAGCCQRRTSVPPARLLRGAPCEAARGFPFRRPQGYAWAPETGSLELLSCRVSDSRVGEPGLCVSLGPPSSWRGLLCGSLCSRAPRRRDAGDWTCLSSSHGKSPSCHLRLFAGHGLCFLKAEARPAVLVAWRPVAPLDSDCGF